MYLLMTSDGQLVTLAARLLVWQSGRVDYIEPTLKPNIFNKGPLFQKFYIYGPSADVLLKGGSSAACWQQLVGSSSSSSSLAEGPYSLMLY